MQQKSGEVHLDHSTSLFELGQTDAKKTGGNPSESMLKQFCEQFLDLTQPVRSQSDSLLALLEQCEDADFDPSAKQAVAFEHQQLLQLLDRVEQQQAFVLIFGPLKSGKSTFMNALCSSYVSEVTSLPAYPCLVHVSYAETASYVASLYNGKRRELESHDALQEFVAEAHLQLIEAVRQCENEGRVFDAINDLPQAIQRIDIKMPVASLERSGAVLVDTPGLYSRMKFGYDRMTRDFQQTAACTVFVVKADNLFLEQVFAEFEQLLDLFSRIFLVVNVDSTKRDLMPDGQLKPSLEQTDPQQVVDAFRTLVMSAPIKEALNDGRLSVYAVDLLTAASDRMRMQQASDGAGREADSPAPLELEEEGPAQSLHELAEGKPRIDRNVAMGFNTLVSDLTEFLNSSDYVQTFMADTVRRGLSLTQDFANTIEGEAFLNLADTLQRQQDEYQRHQRDLAALDRLAQLPWRQHGEPLRDSLFAGARNDLFELADQLQTQVDEAIGRWLASDDSLADLNTQVMQSIQRDFLKKAGVRLLEELRARISGDAGGLSLAVDVMRDLAATGLNLRDQAAAAARQLNMPAAASGPSLQVEAESIPVRRRWFDWLLLRTESRCRRRLFGVDGSRPVKANEKARRLGNTGREAMVEEIKFRFRQQLTHLAEHQAPALVQAYLAEIAQQAKQAIQQRTQRSREAMAALETRLATLRQVMTGVDQFADTLDEGITGLQDLKQKFSLDLSSTACG